jgi:hypothetical protein
METMNAFRWLLAPYISKGGWQPRTCLRRQNSILANQIFDVVLRGRDHSAQNAIALPRSGYPRTPRWTNINVSTGD